MACQRPRSHCIQKTQPPPAPPWQASIGLLSGCCAAGKHRGHARSPGRSRVCCLRMPVCHERAHTNSEPRWQKLVHLCELLLGDLRPQALHLHLGATFSCKWAPSQWSPIYTSSSKFMAANIYIYTTSSNLKLQPVPKLLRRVASALRAFGLAKRIPDLETFDGL